MRGKKKNISNNLKGIMSEMVVAKTMHAAVFIEKMFYPIFFFALCNSGWP